MARPQPQSAFRTPLNEILGTEANVRLLRVLALVDTGLSAAELSKRSQLARTGIYPVLAKLEDVGIVEFAGAGSTRLFELRKAHPLATPLRTLFLREMERSKSLATALREIFAQSSKGVISAWLKDNQDRTNMQGDPDFMTCYVVGDPKALHHVVDFLEDHLTAIESDFQIHIEIVPLSRSEVSTRISAKSLDDVVLLAGVPPKGLLHSEDRKTRNQLMHADHDVSARLLAQAVGAKLRRDPSILRQIRENIIVRMDKASPQERRELKEWLRIISTMSPSKLQKFLIDDGERAVRLRQSLPMAGLLTTHEREKALHDHIAKTNPTASA